MSQPLTITGVQKAPRTAITLGVLGFVALIVFPLLALLPEGHPLRRHVLYRLQRRARP